MKEIIRDYEITFSEEKEVDVPDLQASLIIRSVLDALDISFNEINIKSIIKGSFEVKNEEMTVTFIGEEPEYWFAEADIENKMIEIGINDHRMKIPLFTILKWFSTTQKDER